MALHKMILVYALFCLSASASGSSFHDVPLECQIEGEEGGNFRYLAAQCWLPKAKIIKGVLCVVLHPNGLNGRILANSDGWRILANENECALISVSVVPSADSSKSWVEAREGSGKAFFDAVSFFANASNKPELKNSQIVLAGVCAAGQFAFEVAAFRPTRVAAFVSIGGAKHRLAMAQTASRVPALLVPTEDRGDEATANLKSLLRFGTILGAPWVEAEGKMSDYDDGQCDPVVSIFLRDALRSIDAETLGRFPNVSSSVAPISIRRHSPYTLVTQQQKLPLLSFLGTPLPIQASSETLQQEAYSSVTDGPVRATLFITREPCGIFDTILLPIPIVSKTHIQRIDHLRWQIDIEIQKATLPSGAFSFEVPVRFSQNGRTLLGGVQVAIKGVISRDIYPQPKVLNLSRTNNNQTSTVRLKSHSNTPISEVAIEMVTTHSITARVDKDLNGTPIIQISPNLNIDYSPQDRFVAGHIIVRVVSNGVERIKIPFYGSLPPHNN